MATAGCKAAFYLGTTKVASLSSISNPVTNDSLDVTTFDSNCLKEFIYGLNSTTIDCSGFNDESDTNGQAVLLTAQLAQTILTGAQKPKILWDGTNGIEVDGIVTGVTKDAAIGAPNAFSFTIQGTGAITVI